MKSHIENAVEEGWGIDGQEGERLKTQIENSGRRGWGEGFREGRTLKSQIEDGMGGIEMQIENAWQESMKRGAELKYHVENTGQEGMGRVACMKESH